MDRTEAEGRQGLLVESARDRLHELGLRWTPQRRTLLEVLASTHGHVTGSSLIERCRAADPTTTPSTVYRTLDVLEDLGLVRHSHGADGRAEYHVLPDADHAHLLCASCGHQWELEAGETAGFASELRARRGFEVHVSHLTISGRCAACRGEGAPGAP